MTMDFKELEAYVPLDWLERHFEEYIEKAEKITKVIMIAEARNKGWQKPLKTDSDFKAFIQSEAEEKNMSPEKIIGFLLDAGKIKSRNAIFDKYYSKDLPRNQNGEPVFSKKTILQFIKYTVEDLKSVSIN